MIFDLTQTQVTALAKLARQGALREIRSADPGEQPVRHLWMRTTLSEGLLYGKGDADPTHWAAADVQAFFERYINFDEMIMASEASGLEKNFPDFKLTKGDGMPIFEIRFDLEPHKPSQVRLFGRFLATDALLITSMGEKGIDESGSEIEIDVGRERTLCRSLFEKWFGRKNNVPDFESSLTRRVIL